jgi:hypothetical protein
MLGGEEWYVTNLSHKSGSPAPVFLTKKQCAELERFIDEECSPIPQVFMPVGTIKSGKSTVLERLLPGMIAARWKEGDPRPFILYFQFLPGYTAEAAADHLQDALEKFGRTYSVPFEKEVTHSAALNNLPTNLRQFAQRIKDRGGKLWLLLDELQGPGLRSTPSQAQRFTYIFKEVSMAAVNIKAFVLQKYFSCIRCA